MSVMEPNHWTDGFALYGSRVPMPKNEKAQVQLAWNLTTLCLDVLPPIAVDDLRKINITPDLARDIIKRTNRMKRKQRNSVAIAALFPFALLIGLKIAAIYDGATPEQMRALEEGIGPLCMMTLVPGLGISMFKCRWRRRRTRNRFIKIFRKDIEAADARAHLHPEGALLQPVPV